MTDSGGISTLVVERDTQCSRTVTGEGKMGWKCAQPTCAVIWVNASGAGVANWLGDEGIGFQDRNAAYYGGPHQHRGSNGWQRNARLDKNRWPIWESAKTLGRCASTNSRHCNSGWPIWRPNSRPRGHLCGAAAAARPQRMLTRPFCARWPSASGTGCRFLRSFNQALQPHGGYGYLSEYGIEKIVARSARASDSRGH